MKDYYKILNTPRHATEAEIKLAYRNTAKKYHPDLTHNAEDVLQLQELNEAYTILSNPVKRAAYDAELAKAEPRSGATPRPRPSQTKDASSPHVAAKMKEAMNQYYEEGYVAGYTAAKAEAAANASSTDAKAATLAQENEALRREVKAQIAQRQEMEQRLLEREQALKNETEYADELALRLEWVKDAAVTSETAEIPNPLVMNAQNLEQLIAQLTQDIDRQKVDMRTIAESIATVAQQERRKQIGEELKELMKEVEKRKKELADLKAVEDKKRAVADLDNYFAAMEQRAANWSKKIAADKQLAKSTLYEPLDILIWATGQEIDEAYTNIMAQYADQQKNPSCAEFLKKVRAAYAVLSVPAKRKEYNKSIGYTDQMLENERRLADENKRLQAQYRQKLAEKKFWAKFDDLSSLALMGNPSAQNALGEIYFKGAHIGRDYQNAAYWFREAFEQGYPVAIRNLAICYQNGLGVTKNPEIAESLLRQAELRGAKTAKPAKDKE